jgi:1-acyl-sn-glycerol-3-phosphate acyltransferase
MSSYAGRESNESAGFDYIPHPAVYKLSQYLLRAAIGGVHMHNVENIPEDPAIYVPSHRSIADIAATGVAIYKAKHEPARFMAKKELWNFAPLGHWVDAVGGYPVTRPKKDANGVLQGRAKKDELDPFIVSAKNGENIVVFGEGTRGKGPEIGPLFGGALLIATKAERPIVPVGIAGTKPFRPHDVHVVFGNVIEADEVRELRRARQAGLDTLREEMQSVFDHAHLVGAH